MCRRAAAHRGGGGGGAEEEEDHQQVGSAKTIQEDVGRRAAASICSLSTAPSGGPGGTEVVSGGFDEMLVFLPQGVEFSRCYDRVQYDDAGPS